MSTKSSAAALAQAVKDLSADWEQTKEHWLDAKSVEFERTYLAELPDQVARALDVMQDVDALLEKLRRDCE